MGVSSPETRRVGDRTIIDTSDFVDDVLGDYHDRPQPKREPNLPETEVRVKRGAVEHPNPGKQDP